MQTLQANSLLQGGRYKILSSLGQGGFGITYLALQIGLERKVAIKEFFMKELCERDESTSHVTLGTESSHETVNRFREKFLKEARNIAKLNHPHIVRIHDIFEENGTAYYVMEYAENGSLAEKLRKDGYLSEPVATRYILQVAEALNYLHQQRMNHLDVKPANIMLNEKDETVLIDFGLSKQYDAVTGNQTSTTPIGMSDGYAPIEQYKPGGVSEFSPQTDIYSLGATFFKLLTGSTPPSASDVIEDGVPVDELEAKSISQKTIDVICKAMEGRKKDRMANVKVFIDGLKDTSSSTLSVPEQSTIDDETKVIALKKEETIQSRTFTVNGVSFDMLLVQGGTFTMGATPEMKDPWDAEKPTHDVTLTNNYYLGKTEVTQELWEVVMGNNPSYFKGKNKPVENVSWNDCMKFISRLNSITGQIFRLPTEAEWEFAARGGNNSKHYQYSGSNKLDDVAWYDSNSAKTTHNVATKQPNELGIYDMSGNVWEWCSDYYDKYSSSSQTNPTGPNSGTCHVVRGGSWYNYARRCCSLRRNNNDSDYKDCDLGLRLALSEQK